MSVGGSTPFEDQRGKAEITLRSFGIHGQDRLVVKVDGQDHWRIKAQDQGRMEQHRDHWNVVI